MRPRLRATVLALGATLAVQGIRASDSAAASPPSSDRRDGEAREQAVALYDEGTTLHRASDYAGAIEKFTLALGIVVANDLDDSIRLKLLYNIGRAHEKAYGIDADATHLRKAKELYVEYRDDFAQEHGDLGEELDVEGRLLNVERQLEELASKGESPTNGATPATRGERDEGEKRQSKPRPDRGDRSNVRPLVIGGGVSLGLGLAGLGVMGAGLAKGSTAQQEFESALGPGDEDRRLGLIDDGERANKIAIAGGVTGGIFVVTGAVLVSLGVKRGAGRGKQASVTPSIGRESAMLVIQGRF